MARLSSTTLQSEMTQVELGELCHLLRERSWAGMHLEIGTAAGGTLCAMMKAATKQPHFMVVDSMRYYPDQRQIVEQNVISHGLPLKKVTIQEMHSWDGYIKAQKNGDRFDFILVDGSHKLRHVVEDLHWANLLNIGGVLALHDYHPNTPGVIIAADYFLAQNGNYRNAGLSDSLLLLEKINTDAPGGVRLMPDFWATLLQLYLQLRASLNKRLKRAVVR